MSGVGGRRGRRWRAAAGTALAVALVAGGGGAVAAVGPDLQDPRLLRVRVAADEIDPALDAFLLDGRLYLPAVRLAELIERPHRVSDDGFSLWLEAFGGRPQERVDLTPDGAAAVFDSGVIHIPLDRAETVFGLNLQADLSRDVLTIRSSGGAELPVEARLAREAGWRQREAAVTGPSPPETPLTRTPWAFYAPAMGDVTLTARLGSDDGPDLNYTALIVGELGWLTHELYVSGAADGAPGDLLTSGRRDPGGRVFGVPSLYEATAGDVYGQTLPLLGRAPMGRGISLSGQPLGQTVEFDVTRVEGDALPGWDVELYRNDQLVAIQRVGPEGRYRFEEVALEGGRNRLLVRLYGPQGQMREIVQTVGVGADIPAPGSIRWSAFANAPDQRLFDGVLDRRQRFDGLAAGAMAEIGVVRGLSVGTYGARLPISQRKGSDFAAYGGLIVRSGLGPAATEAVVTTSEAGGWAWRAGAVSSLGALGVTARHEEYLDGYRSLDSERAGGPLRRFSRLRLSAPLSDLAPGLGSLALTAERAERLSDQEDLSARLNWRVESRGVHFDHGLEYRSIRSPGQEAWSEAFYVGAASLTRGRISARAAVRYGLSESGLEAYDASVQYRASKTLIVSAGAFRDELGGRTGGNLALSRDLGFAYANLGASWDDDGGYAVVAGLTFSFGFDSVGARLSSQPQARLGAVEPLVFLDHDGDGQYQPGVDEPLPDVQLLVNRYPAAHARTDGAGRAWLSGLQPGEPVRLAVDPASLPDAFLTPAQPEHAIDPRPGRAFRLDIPVVESGEISGVIEVVDAGGRAPLGGFRLELVDDRGAVRGTAISMFDGVWLFEQVPQGQWIIRAREAQTVEGRAVVPAFLQTTVGPRQLVVEGLGFQFDTRNGDLVAWSPVADSMVSTQQGRLDQ